MVLPSPSDLAELRAFVRDGPATLLAAAASARGPVVRLWIGRPTVLVTEPADVAHVLGVHADAYVKTPRLLEGRAGRLAGDSVIASQPSVARARRRPVHRLLRHPRIDDVRSVVAARVDRVTAGLRAGETLDVPSATLALGKDVFVDATFGPGAPQEVRDAVELRRDLFLRAIHGPVAVPRRAPLALRPRTRRTLRRFDEALEAALDEPSGVLLRGLVAAVGRAQAREEVLGLIVTAHHTIAAALGSALMQVADHPWAAARIRAEGDGYAEMVVAEALRLEPPAWVIVRIARRDDRLPSGATTSRGAKVLVSPLVQHHDPSVWPDPSRFDPDRFSPELRPRISRFAYLPFGAGKHACIGKHFALLETVAALTSIVERFDLERVAGREDALRLRTPDRVEATV